MTDAALLEERADTLVAALVYEGAQFGLAWLDLAAGRFTMLQGEGASALAAELERLKPGQSVHLHINDLDYIDHACLDLLTNWERQYSGTGGSLTIEWDALKRKYQDRHPPRLGAAPAKVAVS